MASGDRLDARWLGRVEYEDALEVQHRLHEGAASYLLLLEHPPVYTLGVRADPANMLVSPASVGARAVSTDRGGDITYHGPGQLVGYPIIDVPIVPDATPTYVHMIERVIIAVLESYGIAAYPLEGYPGVWTGERGSERKIAAIGVKLARARSMHGFALNVSTDMTMFSHIIPCGIADKPVTSMTLEGVSVPVAEVAARIAAAFAENFGFPRLDFAGIDAAGTAGEATAGRPASGRSRLEVRLDKAGFNAVEAVPFATRKPEWARRSAVMGEEYRSLGSLVEGLKLVTVCQEAGCPNIYECWKDGTATFMINGERCTRACAFCLVDTSKPLPLDPLEPERVAEAVERLGLSFAVVTAVARDDLADGGAGAFAETIRAIKERNQGCRVEVLIPDLKGMVEPLQAIFAAQPDVLNHNLETVLRLHRAIRPSANYVRTLALLSRAASAGLVVKSGLIVGMGESRDELDGAMRDLREAGVEILTVGQYLRPTRRHLPVARYYRPEEFGEIREAALSMGFRYVESSPLARSSYHAKRGSEAAGRTSGW